MDENRLEETDQPNVVPLADLTLTLLIILMILSPMLVQSVIHVAAPAIQAQEQEEDSGTEEDKPPEPLLIEITSGGYLLNKRLFPNLDILMKSLRTALQQSNDRPVLVTAQDHITVNKVVHVLDLARQNGAEKISIFKRGEQPA